MSLFRSGRCMFYWRWFLQSSCYEISLEGVGAKPGKKNMKRLIILSLILSLPLNALDVIISNSFENTAPVTISTPETKAEAGVLYSYDADATDANGDLLAYYLTMSPAGMEIDAVTGEVKEIQDTQVFLQNKTQFAILLSQGSA